jgi:hypothetical protein
MFFLYFFPEGQLSNSNNFLSFFLCYSDGGRSGGGDFVAGFLLGGAVFGTLAYIFAPQVNSMFCSKV